MSAFLSNLVDRANGRAPVLQRRRLAIFEPVQAPRTPAGEATFAAEESQQEAPPPKPPETRVSRPPDTPRLQRAVTPPPPPAPPRESSAVPRPAAARPETRLPFEKPPVADAATRPRDYEAPPIPAAAPAEPPVTHTILMHTRETVREVVTPAPGSQEHKIERILVPAAPSVPAAPPVESTRLRPKASRPELPALVPPPRRPAPRTAEPALVPKTLVAPIRRAAPVEPPITRRASRVPQPVPSHPAPIAPVTVTIGSIEFRTAPPASSAPPKPQPAGPKLKLDDYLAARHGGSR